MRVRVTIVAVVFAWALGGCLPPPASVYVRDDAGTTAAFVMHHDDTYTRRSVYNQHLLAERLGSAPISHAEVALVSGRHIECREIELNVENSDQPLLYLDSSSSISFDDVDQIILFRAIPTAKRRQDFLTSVSMVACMSLIGAIGDEGPFKWNKLAVGVCVGSALGSISLMTHEERMERVLVSYEPIR